MTMPSRLSLSPLSVAVSVDVRGSSVPVILRSLRCRLVDRRCVVHLHYGAVLDGADHLVASGDDLIAIRNAVQDFDVGGAGDAGLHFPELGFVVRGDDEDALNFLGVGLYG